MDWNWFFSTTAQSAAAIVGIFSAFVISKTINNKDDYKKKKLKIDDFLHMSNEIKTKGDNLRNDFESYNHDSIIYALEDIRDIIIDEKKIESSEYYYNKIDFTHFYLKEEILKIIDDYLKAIINQEDYTPEYSIVIEYINSPKKIDESGPFKVELNPRLHLSSEVINLVQYANSVSEHIKELRLFYETVKDNPESSKLISSSIILVMILFLIGVIYPISFLPYPEKIPLQLSLSTIDDIAFSFKGALLMSITVIYSCIMSIFFRYNFNMRYDKKKLGDLLIFQDMKQYSEYLHY